MKEINLFNNSLTELTESNLKGLCDLNNIKPEELEYLYLKDNKLENVNFIKKNTPFINLEGISLNDNNITDINNIKYLKKLIYLDLSSNKLSSIISIKTLKKLKLLNLSNNPIYNLDIINDLKGLEKLNISNISSISDLEFLKGLNNLQSLNIMDLNLYSNKMKSLDIIKNLNLKSIKLKGTFPNYSLEILKKN